LTIGTGQRVIVNTMKTEPMQDIAQAFEALRRFGRKQERAEFCELCKLGLAPEHAHLIELTQRRLLCACEACSMLFHDSSGAKYKRVPRDARLLASFQITDADWDSLMIPINLAFFFQSSLDARVSVLYPSPAGATESLLPLGAWNRIAERNPPVAAMETDVEALLVNRVGQARGMSAAEYYIVPIDVCYRLVGLIRMHWRGLSGGTEVWQEIGDFFARLRSQAQLVTEPTHA
jgi:Family of unknown function (DUF5947)